MLIIINGTSSTGKSTVCRTLQQCLGEGWLNFSTDGYLSMLGDRFSELHPDNPNVCTPNDVCYAKRYDDDTYQIVAGPLCSQLYSTIPDVLARLATQGFHLIVDAFIPTRGDLNHYKTVLAQWGTFFVYLSATEETIAAREEARGNRLKGSAIHWLRTFDCQPVSDLVIDTTSLSVENIGDLILNAIHHRSDFIDAMEYKLPANT